MNAVARGQNHRYQSGGGQTATSQKRKTPTEPRNRRPSRRPQRRRGRPLRAGDDLVGFIAALGVSIPAHPFAALPDGGTSYLSALIVLVRTITSGIGSGIIEALSFAFDSDRDDPPRYLPSAAM